MSGAGWYADPSGRQDGFRWWDGEGWTRWLSRNAAAAEPGPEPFAGPSGESNPPTHPGPVEPDYAMRPDDTPKRARRVLVDSANTFTARK